MLELSGAFINFMKNYDSKDLKTKVWYYGQIFDSSI